MKTSIIKDLALVSNIEEEILAKLLNKIELCIEQKVYEDRLKDDYTTEVDIEFATLLISNDNGKSKIKIIPKDEFIEGLRKAELKKNTNLKKKLEKAITDSIVQTFKDIE